MNKFLTCTKLHKYARLSCVRNNLQISRISYTVLRFKSSNVEQIINKNGSFASHDEDICRLDQKKVGLAERLVNKAPLSVQPYLKICRLHRPIGSWLLFWPCGWSIALASTGSFPDLYLLTLFGAGSVVMRGAGCTINDMWDRDIDSKVARTIDRPLVNGTMTMQQALIFLAGQLSVGLLILLQLNWYSVFLGASSLGLVILYPLMKRITYWPQLMLGMTFNWGILLGYSAVQGSVDWSICLPMYTAAVCWTVIYDTIYAHQDIADDILHGIKSTAIKFKENTKYWLTCFLTVMVSCLTCGGVMAEQTWPYYSAVALVTSHSLWQIRAVDIKNPNDCASKFISNHRLGLILFLGIVMGKIVKNRKTHENCRIQSV